MESDTTLVLPREASLVWTNRFGLEASGNSASTTQSFRTFLTLNEPLSTKLAASASVAYNILQTTNTGATTSSSYQDQFQLNLGLSYMFSPRFSMGLNLSYYDLKTDSVNGSYQSEQLTLQGTYLFR